MSFGEHNPYRSTSIDKTGVPVTGQLEIARSKLMPLAIALIVIGILGLLCVGGYFLLTLVAVSADEGLVTPPPGMADAEKTGFYVGAYGVIALFAVNTLLQIVIIAAGVSMLQVRGRVLGIIACILCLIPCFSSSCMIFGIPFGIWGLIVLNDPHVAKAMSKR